MVIVARIRDAFCAAACLGPDPIIPGTLRRHQALPLPARLGEATAFCRAWLLGQQPLTSVQKRCQTKRAQVLARWISGFGCAIVYLAVECRMLGDGRRCTAGCIPWSL